MKVNLLRHLVKEDGPIHYRRKYNATAELALTAENTLEVPIAFTLEHSPLGTVEVTVTLKEKLDYPSLPVIKELKDFIQSLESNGEIP
jgi:hypothetical protein